MLETLGIVVLVGMGVVYLVDVDALNWVRSHSLLFWWDVEE